MALTLRFVTVLTGAYCRRPAQNGFAGCARLALRNPPFGAGSVDGKPLFGSGTIAAAVVVGLLYAANLVYCQRSALQLLDAAASSSDMHANLAWAKGIEEQGWLNPRPYHPWAD